MSASHEAPGPSGGAAEPSALPAAGETIFEVMRTMRAMRRLKPDPVPRELLEQLVEAATWAPSATNGQAYKYVIVTDRAQIARLAVLWRKLVDFYLPLAEQSAQEIVTTEKGRRMIDAVRYQEEHFAATPALIVACYDSSPVKWSALPVLLRSLRGLSWRRRWMVVRHLSRAKLIAEAGSSYPGVQNLLLAARSLGLGATMTSWRLFLEDEFKQALGIPRHITPFAVIPVGYPLGRFGPVSRIPAAAVIRWNHW